MKWKELPLFPLFFCWSYWIFIKKPFERVKGLILRLPLGELFVLKNIASNGPPSPIDLFFFWETFVPLPLVLRVHEITLPPPHLHLPQYPINWLSKRWIAELLDSQPNQILTHHVFPKSFNSWWFYGCTELKEKNKRWWQTPWVTLQELGWFYWYFYYNFKFSFFVINLYH